MGVGWVSLPSCFTPLELELGSRREGAGRKEQCMVSRLYGWPRECEAKETSTCYPAALCSRLGLPGRTGMCSANLYQFRPVNGELLPLSSLFPFAARTQLRFKYGILLVLG